MTQRPLLLRPDEPDAPIEIDRTKLSARLIEIEKALVTAISAVFREKNITHAEYERFREMIRALQDFNAVEGWLDVWLDRMTDETTADEWEGPGGSRNHRPRAPPPATPRGQATHAPTATGCSGQPQTPAGKPDANRPSHHIRTSPSRRRPHRERGRSVCPL